MTPPGGPSDQSSTGLFCAPRRGGRVWLLAPERIRNVFRTKPVRSAPPPSLALLIGRESDALDQLLADVNGGIRSAAHFDELEAEAQAIARRLVSAFRQAGHR